MNARIAARLAGERQLEAAQVGARTRLGESATLPPGAGSNSAATGAPATWLAPSQTAVRAAAGSTLRASARVASVTAATSAARLPGSRSIRRAVGDVERDREAAA